MRHFRTKPNLIHPDYSKHTAGVPVRKLNRVPLVRIPMNMQIGPGCRAIVKPGDKVLLGQPIGEPVAPMSVPVHASVSGEVTAVTVEMQSNSRACEVVEIKNDMRMTPFTDFKAPVIESREDFIKAIRDAGLVGLGGAGFPTHFKLNPPPDKKIDTLLVNGMECEPFITSDDHTVRNRVRQVIEGIHSVLKWCEIPRAIIGMEDNTPEARTILEKALIEYRELLQGKVSLSVIKSAYPQGAEKVLIRTLTGRSVPSGGLPHDVFVLVMNISTVGFVGSYLENGMPLVSRILTLDGPALNRSGIYEVPIGARINDLLELSGGLCKVPTKVIMGGPMMGVAVNNIDSPILKMNNAILVFDEGFARIPPEGPCIHCGRCADVCPMQLMPTELDRFSRRNELGKLEDYAIFDCIECGSCSYICPAGRHIVQNIRVGKALINQKRAAAKAAAARPAAEEKKED